MKRSEPSLVEGGDEGGLDKAGKVGESAAKRGLGPGLRSWFRTASSVRARGDPGGVGSGEVGVYIASIWMLVGRPSWDADVGESAAKKGSGSGPSSCSCTATSVRGRDESGGAGAGEVG